MSHNSKSCEAPLRSSRSELVPTLKNMLGIHYLGPNLGGDAFPTGPDKSLFNTVLGIDWGNDESYSVNAIITNNKVEAIYELKTTEDLTKTMADLQLALYRALVAPLYPGRRVRCILVWTAGPSISEIPPEALDAALARL